MPSQNQPITPIAEPAPAQPAPTQDHWKPIASFVVEFQNGPTSGAAPVQRTKVHHIEADSCAHWSGIVGEELCRWMIAQLAGIAQPDPALESQNHKRHTTTPS